MTAVIKEILQWVQAIILAIVIAFVIRGFVFEPVYVDGSSMENTLSNAQRLIVYKTGYYFSSPKQSDIIVLQIEKGATRYLPFLKDVPFFRKVIPDLDEIDYIKRVIALPGDEVDIRDGYVYVNGERLVESYTKGITEKGIINFPLVVDENKVLVMGDNRQNSRDSRHIGLIEMGKIKGKAVFRIWPMDKIGTIH